jgi:serine/threonine protein phosphatase 1
LTKPQAHATPAQTASNNDHMWWKPSYILSKSSAARIADGVRIYAIGDVHGCSSLLERLLDLIQSHVAAFPSRRPILVFLGDYIDRGPASCQVIDRLILLQNHQEVIFLKGNHESYLIESLKNPTMLPRWFQYGGLETLQSYGLAPRSHFDLKEQESVASALSLALNRHGHREFFDHLKISFVCEDFYFVHAGVRPGIPLDQQSEEDLLWIRDEFLHHKGEHGKIVVHGHTPVPEAEVCTNRINIDTGAYATGRLTCLIIERDQMKFISST